MNIIPKYQQGYGITPVTYTPLQRTTTSPTTTTKKEEDDDDSSSSSSKKSKEGLLTEGIIKILAQNSITNDMDNFLSSTTLFGNSLLDNFGLSDDFSGGVQAKTKELLHYMTAMIRQKQAFDESKKRVSNIEAENEIAIGPGGSEVYTIRDGKITPISISEYNPSKDPLLSNAYLMQMRETLPSSAFSSGMITVLNGATSQLQIDKLIQTKLNKIGSISAEILGYANPNRRETKEQQEGIQFLAGLQLTPQELSGMSPDQMYEITKKIKSNEAQVRSVLDTIKAGLNDTQVGFLRVKAKRLHVKYDDLLSSLVSASLNKEDELHMRILKDYDANGERITSNTDKNKLSAAVNAISFNRGQRKEALLVNGTANGIYTVGITTPLLDKGNKPMGVYKNLSEISQSAISGAFDLRNASLGGYMLDPLALQEVVDTDNDVLIIDLPIDKYAKSRNIIRPDFNAARKMGEAMKEINSLNLNPANKQDIAKINQIVESKGLPPLYDAEGHPKTMDYARFVSFNAVAPEKALDKNINTTQLNLQSPDSVEELEELDKADRNRFEAMAKKFNKDFKLSNSIINGDNVFKGVVYIPVSSNFINTAATSGMELSDKEARQIQADTDALYRQQNNQPTKHSRVNTSGQ